MLPKFILSILTFSLLSSTQTLWAQTTTTEQEQVTGAQRLNLSFLGIVGQTVKEVDQREENELSLGAGILVDLPWKIAGGTFAVESGAIYHQRTYRNERATRSLIQESTRLHVPLLARFWAADFFSIGLGPYLSAQIGDTRRTITRGDASQLDTSADNDLEFGLDAAATLNFLLNPRTGVFVEARYSFPFGQEPGEDADALAALLGVRIAL